MQVKKNLINFKMIQKKTLNDSGVQIKEDKPETKLPDSRLDSCPLLI